MKFLLVSPFTDASGSAIRFWNIAAALHGAGHTVIYVDRRAKRSARLHAAKGVIYHACPSTGMLPLDILVSCLFYAAVLCRHGDCAVFYALKPAPNNGIIALAARLLGKKIILDVDDLDYAYLNAGIARGVLRLFFDRLPGMFHLVTCHTPHLREYLQQTARVPDGKLYYLPQGVSPVFLSLPHQPPEEPPTAKKECIYVATLGHTSDFEDLIPGLRGLFERHPDASLSVVGDGCRRSEFERMVADAGIAGRVRFTGTIDHAALPAFIASHRIGINYMRPSLVNQCRAILKIREYLACGLEVVCNDVGDVALFAGYLHVVPQLDSLFDEVSTLLTQGPRINTAGQAFIREHYQWPVIIDEFLERIATA